MGAFDDLIPASAPAAGGVFDDLIPAKSGGAFDDLIPNVPPNYRPPISILAQDKPRSTATVAVKSPFGGTDNFSPPVNLETPASPTNANNPIPDESQGLLSAIVPQAQTQMPITPRVENVSPIASQSQKALTDYAPDKLNMALQTPVFNYLPKEMQDALSPASFAREVASKNPSDKFMSAVAGVESGLGNIAGAFTSPFNLSMLPAAGLSPSAQKAMGLVFGAQMVAQNPDIGTQLGAEMGKPADQRDTAKIAQLMTEGFANSTLAGLMAGHAAFGKEASPVRSTAQTPESFMQQTADASTVNNAFSDLIPVKGERPLGTAPQTLAGVPIQPAPNQIETALDQLRQEGNTETPPAPPAESMPLGNKPTLSEPLANAPTIAEKAAANPSAPVTMADLASLEALIKGNQLKPEPAKTPEIQEESGGDQTSETDVAPVPAEAASPAAMPEQSAVEPINKGVIQEEMPAFRYSSGQNSDVKFYSKNKDYAEEYAIERGGNPKDVQSVKLKFQNPLVVDLSAKQFEDPSFERYHIEKAKQLGNDAVIFRNGNDEFYVTLTSPTNKTITPINKGGSQENLPSEQQAISKANNSKAAWGDFAASVEKRKAESAPTESYVTGEKKGTQSEAVKSDGGDNTHGIAARVLEKRATAGDIDVIEAGEGISAKESVERGRMLLRESKDPKASFQDLIADRKLGDQVAIARARGEELQKEANAAYEKHGANSPEYKTAKKANQEWAENSKTLATQAHEAMVGHQGEVNLDTGDFHALRQEHLDRTGRDFDPKQEKAAKEKADNSNKANTESEQAKTKLLDTIDKATGRQNVPSDYVLKIAQRIGDRLHQRRDAALDRIKKRYAGNLNADVSGAKVIAESLAALKDEIEIGASHIFDHGLDFAEWSNAMLRDLGDRIKPHLREVFASSQRLLDEEGEKEGGEKPTAVKRTIKKQSVNPVTDALEAAQKTVRESVIRLEKAEEQARVKKSGELNDIYKVQEQAARKALDAAKKTAIDAAERLAKSDSDERIKSASQKSNIESVQEKAAKKALADAESVTRNVAARLAKEEARRDKSASESAKKAAQVQVDATSKVLEMVQDRARKAAIKAAKFADKERQLRSDKPAWILSKVKEYIKAGDTDFGKIVSKVSIDTGLSTNEVRTELGRDKYIKQASDEMYAKTRLARQMRNEAQNWLKDQQRPGWKNFLAKIPRAFFALKVFGHGTVGMITHAGNQMFDLFAAKDYWTNFMRQYPMAFGPSGIFHEKIMEDLQNRPLYKKAIRSGLVVDPHKFSDDYQQPGMTRFFSGMGNRGFDALKLYRMDRFESEWEKLTKDLQTKEMAVLISDAINHSTGVVKASIPKSLQSAITTLMFAPKLEASRWAFAVGDPMKAVDTGLNWKKASPEEKQAALSEVKRKAVLIGTYLAALGVNQGMLSAMNSDQKINFLDYKKPDWLDFKIAGHKLGIVSPVRGMFKFFAKELHDIFGDRSKFENLKGTRSDQMAHDLKQYAAGKVSPFANAGNDVIDRHDFTGNTLPWSSDKPLYKDAHKLSYPEFLSTQFLPIPAEAAIKETWENMGIGDSTIKAMLKAIPTLVIEGGTGARFTKDEPKK